MQKLYAFLLLLFCFLANDSFTQNCYVLLDDNTGMDRSEHQADLEALACTIIDSLPLAYRDSFKVFDYGFYLHHKSMDSDYSEVLSLVRQMATEKAPYYLLFAKETTPEQIYKQFLIDLKLPVIEGSPCFTSAKNESIKALIETEVNRVHEENGRTPYQYNEAEEAGLVMLKRFTQQMTCCQDGFNLNGTTARSNQCNYCFYTPEQQVNLLKDKGMLEIAAEGLTIEIAEDAAYDNLNFETQHTIKITRAYGDDSVHWNFTDQLNAFLPSVTDAKARVLYFDDFTCPNFEEYIDGNFPLRSNVPGLGNASPFFEEIIILNIDGKQRVFFKFEGTDQSEASILWTLEHLAAVKRGGLSYLSKGLEIEECFEGVFNNWLETWQDSKWFSNNWDFLAAAWATETGRVGAYGWSYPITIAIGDYLAPSGQLSALRSGTGRSTKSMEDLEQIGVDNRITFSAGQDEAVANVIYKLYENEPETSGIAAFKACKEESSIFFELTDSENSTEEKSPASRTFFTPSGALIAIPLGATYRFFLCEEGGPDGTLASFTIGNTQYVAWKHIETGKFGGYAPRKEAQYNENIHLPAFPFYDHSAIEFNLSTKKEEVYIRVVKGDKSKLYTTTTTASSYTLSEELSGNQAPREITGADFKPYKPPMYGELDCMICEERDAPTRCKRTLTPSDDLCTFINGEMTFIEEDINDAANALKEAKRFRDGNQFKQSKIRPSGQAHSKRKYFHLLAANNASVLMPNDKARLLDEKLFLLQAYTGIPFYVVYMDLSYSVHEDVKHELAEQVAAKAGLPENAVLITVPYNSYIIGASLETCGNPGLDGDALIIQKEYQSETNSIFDYVLKAFTGIEKPFNNTLLVHLSNGGIVELFHESKERVAGYSAINALQLYRSKYVAIIKNKKRQQPPPGRYSTTEAAQAAILKYETWRKELNDTILIAATAELEALNGIGTKDVFSEEVGDILLRESYQYRPTDRDKVENIPMSYANFHYKQTDDLDYATIQALLKRFSFNPNEHLYENPMHKVIYAKIDGLTLLLAPINADFIGDIAGLTYTLIANSDASGKYLEYGAGVVILGIGELWKSYKVIRKLKTDGSIKYKVLGENAALQDGETLLFTVKAYSKANAQQIVDKINFNRLDREKIENYFQQVGPILVTAVKKDGVVDLKLANDLVSEIFVAHPLFRSDPYWIQQNLANLLVQSGNKRKDLLAEIATFDDATLKAFIGDLNRNPDLVEGFAGNIGLVKVWEIANKHGEPLATDIPFLTKLSDDITNPKFPNESNATGIQIKIALEKPNICIILIARGKSWDKIIKSESKRLFFGEIKK